MVVKETIRLPDQKKNDLNLIDISTTTKGSKESLHLQIHKTDREKKKITLRDGANWMKSPMTKSTRLATP